jgi:hypothetical protein
MIKVHFGGRENPRRYDSFDYDNDNDNDNHNGAKSIR